MPVNIRNELVRELRLKKSWSQEQLADHARLNLRTVQRVESTGAVSLRTRRALAAALGIEPADLDRRDAAPGSHLQALPSFRVIGSWPVVIVACHALLAALLLGATVFDVLYAAQLEAVLSNLAPRGVYSAIADSLLFLGAIGMLLACAALVAAWPVRPARYLVAASMLTGLMLELFLPPALHLLAPDIWAMLDRGGGTLLRLAGHGSSTALALAAWLVLIQRHREPAAEELAPQPVP